MSKKENPFAWNETIQKLWPEPEDFTNRATDEPEVDIDVNQDAAYQAKFQRYVHSILALPED